MKEPIRVLHVLHSMNRGGAENALMNYYRNIDREKVQFDFLLTDHDKCLFEDEIISLGGRVFRVPSLLINNPFPYLKAVKALIRTHPEYHIVHSHTSSKSVFPLWISKSCGVPVRCSHSHNSKTESGITGIIRDALKPLLKLVATDWLSCGEQAAVWLYGEKPARLGKVKVFKNVIETEHFRYNPVKREEYRNKYNISQDTILIGHTARFNTQKNHLFDIDILLSLKNRGYNAKLMLVGDGNLKSDIISKAKRFGVFEDIIFTGVVPNVYDYEQAFDVFILPSLFEGLPLSIIEAQVSGLPCVTTKGTVSYECSVTNLVTYLPLEDGAEVWADKIIEATSRPRIDRWEDIAQAGYDAKTSAKRLQEFYIQRFDESNL